jgi:phage-related tail fiber protein
VAGYGLTDVYTKAQVEAYALSVSGDRVGEVTHFAMATPPPGFLKRNGAAISRTIYAALFARIGTLYGAGDGITTFNLPDSRAHFDRAFDDGRNFDPGRAFGSGQASQNAAHVHAGSAAVAGSHTHSIWINLDRGPGTDGNAIWGDEPYYGSTGAPTSAAGDHTHAITIASSGGSEARPLNTAFLACIKY